MHKLGPKAMKTRQSCMREIGWLADGVDGDQAEWMNCLTTLKRTTNMTHMELYFCFNCAMPAQAIRRDFFMLGIQAKPRKKPKKKYDARLYVISNVKGSITQHCKWAGEKYNTIYTRIAKYMQDGMEQGEALAAALGKQGKVETVDKNDPRNMSKRQRLEYFFDKAEELGILRITSKKGRPPGSGKTRTEPRNPDYSALIVNDMLPEGY